MSRISVLAITPSDKFFSKIESLLLERWGVHYSIERIADLNADIPKSDIALLDKNALPDKSID
ncbi:MAG: hypothetical protein WBG42_00335, partial [Cryomorphaceae bacterium]